MHKPHPLSFVLGAVSGALMLFLVIGGLHLFSPQSAAGGGPGRGQFRGNGGGMNTSRMAQRFGIAEAELQKELDSGKTMQQIAQEHGVTFGAGRRRGGSGSLLAGSGAARSAVTSSSASTSQK